MLSATGSFRFLQFMQNNEFLKRLVLPAIVLFLCGMMPVAAQVKFSRGIKQNVFVEKGQFITGLSASFSQSNQDNYQFLIAEGINGVWEKVSDTQHIQE